MASGIGGGLGGGGSGGGGVDNAPGAHGHWGGASRGRGFHNNAPELSTDTGQPLLDEISKSEGTRGYNDAFAHQHPGTDLSKMTFDQVRDLSKTQSGSSAIGRYQFMSYTLDGLKKELGLKGDEAFTPALQDRLARRLLQRRGYDSWKAGKLSDQAFMHNLSEEWAGLTDPNTGRGFYPGQTTGHSLTEQFSALKAERDRPAKVAAATPSFPSPPHTPHSDPQGHPRWPTFNPNDTEDGHMVGPTSLARSIPSDGPKDRPSWRGAADGAQALMASNWGGDTIHHHYSDDNLVMNYHDHRKTNITVTGTVERLMRSLPRSAAR